MTAAHHETPDVAELRRLAELCTSNPDFPHDGIGSLVRALPVLADRLAHMTEARDNARAEVERLTAQVERVRALADEWTYNGEFGWDGGSHAYGTDCAGQALDYAAAKLRRALDEEPQP